MPALLRLQDRGELIALPRPDVAVVLRCDDERRRKAVTGGDPAVLLPRAGRQRRAEEIRAQGDGGARHQSAEVTAVDAEPPAAGVVPIDERLPGGE
jgi:hypothetical protein